MPRSLAPPPAQAAALWASWQAGPHLPGDLGHIQLVPEFSSQPCKALGTRCGLPSADGVPVALQRYLLTLGHPEDLAQLPGAWRARELLQEGRGQQQLLGTGCRGCSEKEPQARGNQGLGPGWPPAVPCSTHCARFCGGGGTVEHTSPPPPTPATNP